MLTALLIMLREGFEAALVVAIVYAYIRRIDRPELAVPMWQGVAAAAALSVGVGIVVHLTVESLEGNARLLAFAAVSMLAVVVLTWMIFWMRSQAHRIKGELQGSVDQAIAASGDVRLAVMTVAFLAVAREGLEAALFLIAAATTEDGWAVLAGGLLGLAVRGGPRPRPPVGPGADGVRPHQPGLGGASRPAAPPAGQRPLAAGLAGPLRGHARPARQVRRRRPARRGRGRHRAGPPPLPRVLLGFPNSASGSLEGRAC